MATGGIFQLITNDGKQDRMLMATALLSKRLADKGIENATLYDIERTHILFTNAHFKPFAAIGYEYNKVTSSAGSPAFGTPVQFSIPQFGDFFNDMVVHAVLTQASVTQPNGVVASNQNLCRWAAYPGERLLSKVKFEVNGNPLDEYTSEATNFHREFHVQPGKQVGWNRCVGQEDVEQGHVDQPNWANNGVASNLVSHRVVSNSKSGNQTPTGTKLDNTSNPTLEMFIPLLFWMNKDPRLSIPSVAIPYGQRFITVELCKQEEILGEVPRGITTVNADGGWNASLTNNGLASTSINTLELYINNIFVNPDVHNIFIKRIGFTLIRVHRRQVQSTTGGNAQSILLQQLKWPIEALYVGLRPANYNSTQSHLAKQHLDKWHRFCNVTETSRVNQGWLSQRQQQHVGTTFDSLLDNAGLTAAQKPATAQFIIAATNGVGSPALALTGPTTMDVSSLFKVGSNFAVLKGGTTFTGRVTGITGTGATQIIVFEEKVTDNLVATAFNGGANDILTGVPVTNSSVTNSYESQSSTVEVLTPTVTAITIKAHGIPIYNNFPGKFFNAYIPYNYGGPNIRTPEDPGAMLITFCLYPGTYQPSGHINVSRAREFYIDFSADSSINATTNPGVLIIIASAINFLLISDGSAVLRYST
jgi:hypothetical protein